MNKDIKLIAEAYGRISTAGSKFTATDGTVTWKSPTGDYHRIGAPAIIHPSGTKEWFVNNKRHRDDGPAIEWASGGREWYVNDKRHREDGPAIKLSDGTIEWHVNGVKKTQDEVEGQKRTPHV